ncbi:hypothetical protein C4564_06260 [Candidatus Microgenomates bacterium]|nr:MAG: hypothetical protein C4564_06260 [Candidatus Microgenomates bacterium]
MALRISVDGVQLTDNLRLLLDEKLSSEINKYLGENADDAVVNIKAGSRWGFAVSLDLNVPGHERVFAHAKEKELHAAVNALRSDISSQLRKYKEKRARK